MADHPILFKGDMVRAILEDRKTVARDMVEPQPVHDEPRWLFGDGHSGVGWYCCEDEYPELGSDFWRCPYGVPGDRLWVQETWATIYKDEQPRLLLKADRVGTLLGNIFGEEFRWKPSIHMPRCASRITLEVTEVRVERLQHITLEEVRAEGVPETWGDWGGHQPKMESHEWDNMRWDEQWQWSWDSSNANHGYPWADNCWVWVVRFKRIEVEDG